MRTTKHLTSLLICALLLCVLYITSTEAQAATHSHPVCGSSCTCASEDHSSSTWTAWDGTTKLMNGD